MMSSEEAARAVAIIVPSPLAGEGGSMLSRVRMGEGYVAAPTPHPFESLGTPLCPLPQGARAREASAARFGETNPRIISPSGSSPRGVPRDARVAGTPLRGPMITAGGYGSRLSLRSGRDDSRFSLEHQPAAVRNDGRRRFPVSGLLIQGMVQLQRVGSPGADVAPSVVTIRRNRICHHPSS